MPDGDPTQTGQEPTNNNSTTAEPNGTGRSIDSFPEEAQDYIRRLRQENAEHRNRLKDATGRLKDFEDKDKSASQKLEERAQAAERQALESATRLLRYEVAAEKGLPLNLAGRLQGATKEELAADADKLKKDFGLTDEGGSAGGSGGFDAGVRRPVKRPKTMNGLIRSAQGH